MQTDSHSTRGAAIFPDTIPGMVKQVTAGTFSDWADLMRKGHLTDRLWLRGRDKNHFHPLHLF
jgi:hypothetical protein